MSIDWQHPCAQAMAALGIGGPVGRFGQPCSFHGQLEPLCLGPPLTTDQLVLGSCGIPASAGF